MKKNIKYFLFPFKVHVNKYTKRAFTFTIKVEDMTNWTKTVLQIFLLIRVTSIHWPVNLKANY